MNLDRGLPSSPEVQAFKKPLGSLVAGISLDEFAKTQ